MKMKSKIPRQLLEAFESTEPYPINLEWLVIPMKYKHISSLTTHLKRHFSEGVDYVKYKEEAHGQRTTWVYYVSTKCFRGICNYCRHSDRKKVAQHLLDESENCSNLLHFNPQRRMALSLNSPSTDSEEEQEEEDVDNGMNTEYEDEQEDVSCSEESFNESCGESEAEDSIQLIRPPSFPSLSQQPTAIIRESPDKSAFDFIAQPLLQEFFSYNFLNSGSPPLDDLELLPANGIEEVNMFMESLEQQKKEHAPIVNRSTSQRPSA